MYFITYYTLKGPRISLDVPSLGFGLIRLGDIVSRPLQITNHSNCSVNYEVRQLVATQSVNKTVKVELPTVVRNETVLVPVPVLV